ncbi:MAG: phosphoribosyltransferase family protein [Flavobacteriaceae bacterium]|nr:phosphoribosyltransferase family protein [Flavobacteriaceae bacterium]
MSWLDILFPNRCLECDTIIKGEEIVCISCLEKINFTHWEFGDNPLKQKAEFLFPLEKAFALMYFEQLGLSRKIIHELKYKNQEKIGKILAHWVAERVNLNESKPDLLVNIPLHPKKLKQRGYNQLHLFTECLSALWGIPYRHDLLKRNHYKKAQATKDKSHREDTQNAFSCTENIENQHVLLIDDVFTTGNTMSAAAWEILKKNNKVSILVMAMD